MGPGPIGLEPGGSAAFWRPQPNSPDGLDRPGLARLPVSGVPPDPCGDTRTPLDSATRQNSAQLVNAGKRLHIHVLACGRV